MLTKLLGILIFFISFEQLIGQDKKIIDSLLKIIKIDKQDTNLIYAYNDLSVQFEGVDDVKAKEYAQKACKLAKKLNNKNLTAWSLNVLGLAYDYLAMPDSALFYYQESIAIKKIINDKSGIAATTLNIGVLYFYQNNFEKAIAYYNEALIKYTELKNEIRIAGVYNNIGAIYRQQKKYDQAIEVFEKALALKIKNKDSTGIANALGNLGVVYQYKGNYKKSEELQLMSIKIDSLKNNLYNIVSSRISLAELYLYMAKYASCEKNLLTGIELGEQINAIHYLDDAYKVYTNLDSIQKNYEKGFEHLKKYQHYSNLVFQKEKSEQLDKLEIVFNAKEKEKEIELLNANSLINDLTIQKQEKQLVLVLIVSVIMAALLVFSFFSYSSLKKSRQILSEKNKIINENLIEKDVLMQEIHHRVKNNLQLMSSLLSIQSRYIKDEKAIEAIKESRDRVKSMALIHQDLYQQSEISKINVKLYLEKLIGNLKISYNLKEEGQKIILEADQCLVDVDLMIAVGLIINELVTNSIKHNFTQNKNSEIKIMFKLLENQYFILVKDNGKGFPPNFSIEKSASFGLKLIHIFKEKLKAQLTIKNENGAAIEFYIPIKK